MWRPVNDGATIGLPGSAGGITVRDVEHDLGARATLERDCEHCPWSVTCGITGWFVHTRFLSAEAEAEFAAMLGEVADILDLVRRTDDPEAGVKRDEVYEAIDRFVNRFP